MLSSHLCIFLEKDRPFWYFSRVKDWVSYFIIELWKFLYSLDPSPSSDTRFANISSHSMHCLFTFSMVCIIYSKMCLVLIKLNLSVFFFSLVTCAFGIVSKRLCSTPEWWGFAPIISPKGFIVFVHTLRTLMHFELIFAEDGRQGSKLGIWGVRIHCFSAVWWKDSLFPRAP